MSYVSDTLEHGELVVHQTHVSSISYIAAALWLLLTMSPGGLAKMSSTELVLTDRRVIGKHGVIARHSIAVPYKELERISVSRGVLGRLLGFGMVTVVGRDGRKVKFKGIARPRELQAKADEFIEMAVLGRRLPRFEEVAEVAPPSAPPPAPRMEEVVSPPSEPARKTPILPKKPQDPNAW